MKDDEENYCLEGEDEGEPWADDCSGNFSPPATGPFICGMAGSEHCEFECPYRNWLGLTMAQVEKLEKRQKS